MRRTKHLAFVTIIALALALFSFAVWSQIHYSSRRFTVTTGRGHVYQHMRYKGNAGIGGGSRYVSPEGKEVVITGDHTAVEE